MAKCSICGAKAGLMMSMCDACIEKSNGASTEQIKKTEAKEAAQAKSIQNSNFGATILVLGIGIATYGLYTLFYPAVEETQTVLQIANLHKLFLGSTFTIVGTMLSLAGAKSCKLI